MTEFTTTLGRGGTPSTVEKHLTGFLKNLLYVSFTTSSSLTPIGPTFAFHKGIDYRSLKFSTTKVIERA